MSDDNDTPDIEVEEAPRKKRRSSSRRKVAQSSSYAADCSYKERPLFEPGKCCCAACLRLRG